MTVSEHQALVVELSRRRTAAEAEHAAAVRRLAAMRRVVKGSERSVELVARRDAAAVAAEEAEAALRALEAEAAEAAKIQPEPDPIQRSGPSNRCLWPY